MIDKLKQYEKAFSEFIEWLNKEHEIKQHAYGYIQQYEGEGNYRFISERELYSLCIEWLDSKGVYVMALYYGEENEFAVNLHIKFPYLEYVVNLYEEEKLKIFNSRSEATEAGIIKGFGIYNQKEK